MDRRRPSLLAVPVSLLALAAGLLAACGSGDGSGVGSATSSSTPTRSDGSAPARTLRTGAEAPDGLLAVRVEGRRLFLTVTAGSSPLVALADLSAAQVEADGSRWTVSLARPDGGRDQDPDRAASWRALVVQPGGSVEVGPYELGPRPPTSVEVCLEVVAPTTAQADQETGTAVRLADRDGPASQLCRTVEL